MRLKSLRINGFKSFADEVELLFEEGITVIVGPNGCGKSNISDAIRWVLGEQSARSLRCARMEELIFNGGSNGSPKKFAYVALRLSNEDGFLPIDSSEVEIARQLTRSGESKYFINGSQCLLRDIQNLFLDTGIGTSAYYLMEQNNIDFILNSKPLERRYLFDEVAGINRYKQRKAEALRKLEETEANLARINDVIAELERETESLKEQAERARIYLDLMERLKKADVERNRRRYRSLAEELGSIEGKLGEVESKLGEREGELARLEAELREVSSRKEEIDGEIEEVSGRIRKVESELDRTRSSIAIYADRRKTLLASAAQVRKELEAASKRRGELEEEIGRRIDERRRVEVSIELERSRLRAHESFIAEMDRRIRKAKEEIEGIRRRTIQVMEERSRVQNELSSISSKAELSRRRLAKLSEEGDALERELYQLRSSLEGARRRRKLVEAEIIGLNAELRSVESEINSLQEELRRIEAEISGTQNSLGLTLSRLESLKELQSSYEGYINGVRAVMKAKELRPEEFRGICGVVGELLRTEPEYELAIEVALGSGIHNVVTETAEDAQRAIELLKSARAGRVTFLPLDLLRARRFEGSSEMLLQEGVIGIASELVRFDPKYRTVVEYLLGNTVVVESLEVAVDLLRRFGSPVRFVTLEGEMVSPSGAITGGYGRVKSSGLLSRAREIEELQERAEKLSMKLRKKEEERRAASARLSALQKRKGELILSSQEGRVKLAELSKEIQSLEERERRLLRQMEVLRSEGEVIERELEEMEGEAEKLKAKLEELKRDEATLNRKLKRLTEQVEIEENKRDEAERRCSEERVKLAKMEEQLKGIEEAISAMEEERRRIGERIEEMRRQAESQEELKEELSRRIEEEKGRFAELERHLSQLREKLASLQGEREEVDRRIRGVEDRIGSVRRSISSLESRKHQLEISLREVQVQIDSIRRYLYERYGEEIESAEPAFQGRSDEELKAVIESTKSEIESMGAVNLRAIDDYNSYKERFDFMIAQRDDLLEARRSIYKAIDRINAASRRVFLESFEKVNGNFREVFGELFEGGEAELRLIGDDPLECGVEIIACPPGKRPQSISQLSGGERALVAIALLFAIFKLKPAPFCILDEVDAALDEANVLRFTGLIKRFSKEVQFIIITHNKRTMEIADLMYGVTMEKAGVSKVISVKFSP